MRVLLNDNHTPHAYMVAQSLPEVQFDTWGWNGGLRPLPENVRLRDRQECLHDEYAAVIDDDYALPTFAAQTLRRVFLLHCEYNLGTELPPAFAACDRLVVVSEHRRATMREMGLHSKVSVIPPGFAVQDWSQAEYGNGEVVVGTVGNGWNWNEENRLFAEQLAQRFPLTVIGHNNEAVRGARLVANWGLEGYQQALAGIGIFVYCVGGEVLGMAPMEAMACGLPVVLGNYPEAGNFAFSDWNCLITRRPPLESVEWITQQVQRLQQSPELRHRIGMAGRQTMAALYSLELCGNRWREVLFA